MPGTLNPVGFFVSGDTGPTVNASSAPVFHLADLNPVRAGVTYNGSGFEFSNSGGTSSYSVSRGSWLTSGSASDVWMEWSWTGDTLDVSPASTPPRLQMNTGRLFEIQDTSYLGGSESGSLTVSFYDASSGGALLDSVTFNLTAERESGA